MENDGCQGTTRALCDPGQPGAREPGRVVPGKWTPKTWGDLKRAGLAAGMTLRQNGDSEGCMSFDPKGRFPRNRERQWQNGSQKLVLRRILLVNC